MQALTLIEALAMQKLLEKKVAELEKRGGRVEPGQYAFDLTVSTNGLLARGEPTDAAPAFKPVDLLKPLLLMYAGTLNKAKPGAGQEWLNTLLATDGALGSVIRQGAEEVMKKTDPALTAIWDAAVAAAKDLFHATMPRVARSGNTTVVGELAPVSRGVETPTPLEAVKPYETAIAEAAAIATPVSATAGKVARALKPDASYAPPSTSAAALSVLDKTKRTKRGGK